MKTTMSQGETVRHTPGPWTTGNSLVPFGITIWKERDENRNVPRICRNVSTLANARLIAAAPDLLEACKVAREWCRTHAGWNTDIEKVLFRAIDRATTQKEGAK